MKATLTLTGLVATVLAGASMASAQSYVIPSTEVASATTSGGYSSGGGYGENGYHASTAEEGYLAGLGFLTRSQGEANYFNSLAAINGQEAYNRYLQNREKRTETYFRMQQINRAAREAQRPQPLSFERYVALARQQTPEPLSDREYDRTSGSLLAGPVGHGGFQAEREAARTAPIWSVIRLMPAAASAFHRTVWQLAQAMDLKLKQKAGQVGSAEYLASKNFIQSLSYEAAAAARPGRSRAMTTKQPAMRRHALWRWACNALAERPNRVWPFAALSRTPARKAPQITLVCGVFLS
jgi:hypothetical protein